MTTRQVFEAYPQALQWLAQVFDQIGAARACSAAIRRGRRPDAAALRVLGISEDAIDQLELRK